MTNAFAELAGAFVNFEVYYTTKWLLGSSDRGEKPDDLVVLRLKFGE